MGKITVDVKERSPDELEAQVKKQGGAMAALKREVDEMRRALAKGALEIMRAGENHDAGSAAAGKDADGLPAQPPPPKGEALMALVEALIAARVKDVRDELESQVRGLKEQLEGAKSEARDAANEVRAMVKRQAAEITDVKATAAHIDSRMNDVELAAAEWKDAPREKDAPPAERSDASEREHAGAEGREGKRRKREEAGKGDEMAHAAGSPDAAACGGAVPVVESSASIEKRDAADDAKWEVDCQELKGRVDAMACRVAKLEKTSGEGKMIWEAMLTLWAAAAPDQTQMDLSGITCLTDAALTHLTSLHSLTSINLRGSSGYTAAGMRKLYSLKGLLRLELGIPVTDSGIKHLRNMKLLEKLSLRDASITESGMKWLKGLKCLQKVATDSYEIEELIRDILPGVIVTSGPLNA
ncbi:unnamed protein product [Closterium sp. Naga37s-1]|nr:unnamed protein product [Closterium sp. Naga37s-1]